MDNASFYRSDTIEQLCTEAGVKLLYLPLYSPDLNPIEEFFVELKAFIKRNWQDYAKLPRQLLPFRRYCLSELRRVLGGGVDSSLPRETIV